MKNLKLSRRAAALFKRLEEGGDLTSGEQAIVRESVHRLLRKISAALFIEDRDWIAEQQEYTGRIIDALTRAHFKAKR